jgi:hypothetical protein
VPFIHKPDGLSSGALELLDTAMTKLWLDQVAIAAAKNGVTPIGLRSARDDNDRNHDRLGLRNPPSGRNQSSTSSENRMPPHKYKTGQDVFYHPPKGTMLGASRYKVVRPLPTEGGEIKYRIKSAAEHFERVAKESELTRSQQETK